MQVKPFSGRLARIVVGALLCALWATTLRASLVDNLLGYWQFNGDGSDSSPNNRDLTISGGAGFAAGLLGSALDLHHNNSQYAALTSDNAVFDFGTSDFTIQVWVNYNTSAYEQTLIEKFTGGGGPDWTLTSFPTPGVTSQFFVHGGPVLDGSYPLTSGMWHHVVARRSGSLLELYNDVSLAATGSRSGALTATSNPLLIGKRNDGDGRDFSLNGRLDEIAIWNRALSNSELIALYNGGAGAIVPEPSTLVLLGLGTLMAACSRFARRSRTKRNGK